MQLKIFISYPCEDKDIGEFEHTVRKDPELGLRGNYTLQCTFCDNSDTWLCHNRNGHRNFHKPDISVHRDS